MALIVNPQQVEAEQLVNGLNSYVQNAVDEYSKTVMASVLKAFENSPVSEEFMQTKAKL